MSYQNNTGAFGAIFLLKAPFSSAEDSGPFLQQCLLFSI